MPRLLEEMEDDPSVLPAINQGTVWAEAKRLLLSNGGVTNRDLIHKVVYEDRTIEEAYPEAVRHIEEKIVASNHQLDHLKEQVHRWRRNLAMEALHSIDHDRRIELIQQLKQKYAD